MKKKVALLMGGWSAEREISLVSAQGVKKALEELGHDVTPIDVTRNLEALSSALEPDFDVVFNALHGTGGEDGVIQGLLQIRNIPYTHCGVMASAVGMNKLMSLKLFDQANLPIAPHTIVSYDKLSQCNPYEFPYVVKPISDGSSKGVFIVFSEEDKKKHMESTQSWPFGKDALIEKYIPGREIQVAVMGDKAIGAIEICPLTGFYDYEAKYTSGKAKHLMPAPLAPHHYEMALDLALKAHQAIDARGITRTDLRFDDTNPNQEPKFYILEVNTQPGMTPLSLVPEIAAHSGISYTDLVQWLLDHATCD